MAKAKALNMEIKTMLKVFSFIVHLHITDRAKNQHDKSDEKRGRDRKENTGEDHI